MKDISIFMPPTEALAHVGISFKVSLFTYQLIGKTQLLK